MLMTNHARKKRKKSPGNRNLHRKEIASVVPHGYAATCIRSYEKASTICWFVTSRVDMQTCLEDFVVASGEDMKAGSQQALSRAGSNQREKGSCSLCWTLPPLLRRWYKEPAPSTGFGVPALTLTGVGGQNELCSPLRPEPLSGHCPARRAQFPDTENA